MPKKIKRGDSLVSPGMICYAEKQVKPFWSSSLGLMVLFDTIIFCRTFKNYFGQFVWIEASVFMKRRLKKSHYNSRVSLHEAPTKNRKGRPFSLARFCKFTKTFLAEARTRNSERWVSPKPVNFWRKNKPGTAQVCAISKAQKQQDFKVASIILPYPKNPKVGPNWRAKRGDFFGFFNIHCCKKSKKMKGTL